MKQQVIFLFIKFIKKNLLNYYILKEGIYMTEPAGKILPFLSFKGNAKEAINFYISVFPGAKILSLEYITDEAYGKPGKILNVLFEIMGQQFMAMDMDEQHSPNFSWAVSMYINCDSEEEFDMIFGRLSEDGLIMMGPEPVLEFKKVAWVTDKYNFTWQLVWK